MGKFRFDERIEDARLAALINLDTLPDAGVAVAHTVVEGEVPAGAHQHGHIAANPAVAAIVELLAGAPCAARQRTGAVNREHLYGQHILLSEPDEFAYLYPLLPEHSGPGGEKLAVEPHLGVVVDAVQLHPDAAAGIIGVWELQLCAEPVGIFVATGAGQVGNQPFLDVVVVAKIRVGIDAVLYQRVQHGTGHNRLHPVGIVIAGQRQFLCRHVHFGGLLHLPDIIAAVLFAGVQDVSIRTFLGSLTAQIARSRANYGCRFRFCLQ